MYCNMERIYFNVNAAGASVDKLTNEGPGYVIRLRHIGQSRPIDMYSVKVIATVSDQIILLYLYTGTLYFLSILSSDLSCASNTDIKALASFLFHPLQTL